MTRITSPTQKNAMSVMKDILEMNTEQDPESAEVDSLLESLGTHAYLAEKIVVYNGSELSHVHTKKTLYKNNS
ncbi:hypothetical protein [Methanohalophilus sp.]|uniref:hypothetical protein n=1 Tax=Methanohalophilus sp. TaxID=1966352 RepID=UPI00260CA084|nr:hypothetical protein [Methanohalophilus sp.]MDK2892984.1 hypothetical protein [Methanohalophilus sp.]